jgi:hypothetical protein
MNEFRFGQISQSSISALRLFLPTSAAGPRMQVTNYAFAIHFILFLTHVWSLSNSCFVTEPDAMQCA